MNETGSKILFASVFFLYALTSLEIKAALTTYNIYLKCIVHSSITFPLLIWKSFHHYEVLHLILFDLIEVSKIWLYVRCILSVNLCIKIIFWCNRWRYSYENRICKIIVTSKTGREIVTGSWRFSCKRNLIAEWTIKSNLNCWISRVYVENQFNCFIHQFFNLLAEVEKVHFLLLVIAVVEVRCSQSNYWVSVTNLADTKSDRYSYLHSQINFDPITWFDILFRQIGTSTSSEKGVPCNHKLFISWSLYFLISVVDEHVQFSFNLLCISLDISDSCNQSQGCILSITWNLN